MYNNYFESILSNINVENIFSINPTDLDILFESTYLTYDEYIDILSITGSIIIKPVDDGNPYIDHDVIPNCVTYHGKNGVYSWIQYPFSPNPIIETVCRHIF